MESNNFDMNLVRRLGFQLLKLYGCNKMTSLHWVSNSLYYKEQVFGSGDTRWTLTYFIGFMWAVVLWVSFNFILPTPTPNITNFYVGGAVE